jgi:hypothetical protein
VVKVLYDDVVRATLSVREREARQLKLGRDLVRSRRLRRRAERGLAKASRLGLESERASQQLQSTGLVGD